MAPDDGRDFDVRRPWINHVLPWAAPTAFMVVVVWVVARRFPPSWLLDTWLVVGAGVALIVVVGLVSFATAPIRVHVGLEGVRFTSRIGSRLLTWNELRAPVSGVVQRAVYLPYSTSSGGTAWHAARVGSAHAMNAIVEAPWHSHWELAEGIALWIKRGVDYEDAHPGKHWG
jgi:hypothetical protein